MQRESFQIRPAQKDDAGVICELSRDLGYTAGENRLRDRLESALESSGRMVFTARTPGHGTIAWIHVYKALSLQSGRYAEIGGFVVSEDFRDRGVGTRLLEAAMAWAAEKGVKRLRVRSRVTRKAAKKFYLKKGFTVSKKQRVFEIELAPVKQP